MEENAIACKVRKERRRGSWLGKRMWKREEG
jgi:hypothetical protein